MMYTKEKIALGIFIFSLVVLSALIFIAFQTPRNEITGKAIEEVGKEVKEAEITCSDSDGGRDYSVKGVVNYCDSSGCSTKEDSCSGKSLIEEYCENNKRRYEEYNCDYDCDDGVCVSLVTKYKSPYSSGGGGSGSGGGGTGGGSSVVTETGQTYDLGELTSEHHLELSKNDNLKLSISGTEYMLTLRDNTETQVTISASNGQTFTILVGEDKIIDLNNDGISETYIKIESINIITNKIKLILRAA